ncbi:MAG: hypothetical protein INF84_12595 [Roseomonas sp.]|nr:hypothetical protein [Roseomonas sp.]
MAKLFSALTRNVAPLALLVLALGLSACASGAKPGAMLAPNTAQTTISANSNLREAVGIGQVSGGRETNPLWVSDVSSSDLAEALRLSLSVRTMLAIRDERFRLEANMINLQQPMMGLDMTVTSKVRYRLTRLSDNTIVFEREITAPFTAAFSSSLVGVERLKLANEGSIRENISQFLAALIAAEAENPAAFGRASRPRTS